MKQQQQLTKKQEKIFVPALIILITAAYLAVCNEKISDNVIFLLGIFAMICGLMAWTIVEEKKEIERSTDTSDYDETWTDEKDSIIV